MIKAVERVQYLTSLQRLLRDPLGFVWRYGLGWSALQDREQALAMAPAEFGKLEHEPLQRAVTCSNLSLVMRCRARSGTVG
jgi:hypothetical protein